MSKLQRFFSGVTETSDHAKEKELRTRYYRNRLTEAVEAIKQIITQQPSCFQLVHVDERRGEIMLEYKNGLGLTHDLVVTIYELTPVQIAVDVHAALRSRFVDFGWNQKAIGILYEGLDRQLTRDQDQQ